jgi:hypothetical protein
VSSSLFRLSAIDLIAASILLAWSIGSIIEQNYT